MQRLSAHMCPRFQAAVAILSRRWTALIVQALTERPHRFCELTEHLEVVSERVLSERLKELGTEGIVERRVIPDSPVQVEYRLTDKGLALRGVMHAIGAWAEQWVQTPKARSGKRPR